MRDSFFPRRTSPTLRDVNSVPAATDPPASVDGAPAVFRYGPTAWLLEPAVSRPEAVQDFVECIQRFPPEGLREIVPAFNRLLLDFSAVPDPVDWTTWLAKWRLVADPVAGRLDGGTAERIREIPVHFDGADLARVANHAGGSAEAWIDRFIAAEYRVQCLGFAPGFPYLRGLPSALHTPRLSVPRPRVPAGSVAVGGGHAGIYPQASPGGWNLLGWTRVRLFNPDASSVAAMFHLHAGDRVRFVRDPGGGEPESPPLISLTEVPPPFPLFRVLATGWGMSFQDLGRPGFGRFGVPAGGAMDPAAAQAANQVLGNRATDAVLELCGPGQILQAERDLWLGLAGADAAEGHRAITRRLRAGERFQLPTTSRRQVWSYLAIPGGFAATRFLGSASVNARAGLGASLRAGARIGGERESQPPWPDAVQRRFLPAATERQGPLRVWPGPQWSRFSVAAREAFFGANWTVSQQSDRVGYRLSGPALRVPNGEMISEPVLPGSIQVPPNGLPIVTMPDGPTLGGYPKLGLVDPEDLPRLAQTLPGSTLRFTLRD